MDCREFMTQLHERCPDLAHELPRKGSLRGLFDTASAEWKSTTPQEKLQTIKSLAAYGFTVQRMEEPFVDLLYRCGYPEDYARREFHEGVCTLLAEAARPSLLETIAEAAR